MIDAIAVCRCLSAEHHFVEFADAKCATLTTSENFDLEQETTVNVNNDLVGATEIGVEQSKTFVA